MTTFRYVVEVDTDTASHADTVMALSRLAKEPDTDYGFNHTVTFRTMTVDEHRASTNAAYDALHEQFPQLALVPSGVMFALCGGCGSMWTADANDDGWYVDQYVNASPHLQRMNPTVLAAKCVCKAIHERADDSGHLAAEDAIPDLRDALSDMLALATDAIEITPDDQRRIDAARAALQATNPGETP